MLISCQNFGSAIFLIFGETIFTNSLKTLIAQYVPGVDAKTLIAAGATGWRSILSDSQVAGLLKAYAGSIDRVFYLATGASIAAMIFACGMGWGDIRKKKVVEQNA